MLRALNAGAINVSIKNLTEGIEGCRVGGFDCLALSPGLIADQTAEEVTEELFESMVAPGAWGIPFNWRGTEEEYNAGLETMRSQVIKMHDIDVKRCATWIMPGSNDLTLDQNTEYHRTRLQPIANLLEDLTGFELLHPIQAIGHRIEQAALCVGLLRRSTMCRFALRRVAACQSNRHQHQSAADDRRRRG